MSVIETQSSYASSLKGLHLFHFAMSNCSQRVRLALEEKGLQWQSHHVDLSKNEHATDWYQAINPAGLVPTLVHDGVVIVESLHIVQYLEDKFPDKRLNIPSQDRHPDKLALFGQADALQGAVKLLSHEFLFKPKRQMSAQQIQEFERRHKNTDLVVFARNFSMGFEASRIRENVSLMQQACLRLEKSLKDSDGDWLLGDALSFIDIAWIVNIHRLALMQWDFASTPSVKRWLLTFRQRTSFRVAITAYEPLPLRALLSIYASVRRWSGSGVTTYQRIAI